MTLPRALFFGPRGNGKTSLLAEIAADARLRGMRAESLPASALGKTTTPTRRLQDRARLIGARLTGAQAAGFGVSARPAAPPEAPAALMGAWIGAEARPLVILLDEAHAAAPDAGRLFLEAVQEATTRALPFLLLAAGTPDAPRRLRRAGTFTERMLERVPVGRLTRRETLPALVSPAEDAGLPLGDEAAVRLAAESQDYPYFIPLIGSAAWDAGASAGASGISDRFARAGVAVAAPRIAEFYAERFGEARSRKAGKVLPALARQVCRRGGRPFGELEVGTVMDTLAASETLPGDGNWLLDTLSDLGVPWRSPAGWEMGIPSFADCLLTLDRPAAIRN